MPHGDELFIQPVIDYIIQVLQSSDWRGEVPMGTVV
jgi:hypothetical protein